MRKIFVINPGATSTKVAVFHDREMVLKETIDHINEELSSFDKIFEQRKYRESILNEWLKKNGILISDYDAVVARGGLLKPMIGGSYLVNEKMIEDLEKAEYGEHASNLGAAIAWDIGHPGNLPCYIVDPVSVDEMSPVARISGLKELPRRSLFHALNSRAVAISYANSIGSKYNEMNLVVVHLGSGISVSVHSEGMVRDVNNALESGPMSPDRAGALPAKSLVNLAFSGKYTEYELIKKMNRAGGLQDHLGTTDLRVAEKMARNNEYAEIVLDAMIYQISKEVGAMVAALRGQVDAIIVTGGMAYSEWLKGEIEESVSFLAPLVFMPGEMEMEALAEGVLRVLEKEEQAKLYM